MQKLCKNYSSYYSLFEEFNPGVNPPYKFLAILQCINWPICKEGGLERADYQNIFAESSAMTDGMLFSKCLWLCTGFALN